MHGGGYQTDKTMTYVFRGAVPRQAEEMHSRCTGIMEEMASMLVPGAVPSRIYSSVIEGQEPGFLEHFMGHAEPPVRFLGHGVGLAVDEPPVIALGFDEPLEEGMAIALEPKYAFPGVGLVGIGEYVPRHTPRRREHHRGESRADTHPLTSSPSFLRVAKAP